MKLVRTSQTPEVGLSHNEDIKKKVFLEKGYIPQLMNFSSATFKPGQAVESHQHLTMFEVFYLISGSADFVVNQEKITLNAGDCITIEPGEVHSQHNPYNEDVVWLYFGIATD
jgi:mannose-6-phosphate isomerase-like protein (cupin superfamily)